MLDFGSCRHDSRTCLRYLNEVFITTCFQSELHVTSLHHQATLKRLRSVRFQKPLWKEMEAEDGQMEYFGSDEFPVEGNNVGSSVCGEITCGLRGKLSRVQNKCLDKERIWYLMVAYGCKQYTLPVLTLKYVRHFSSPPKKSSVSVQSESRSGVTNGCWGIFTTIHLPLRAIREVWAQFESRRGSSYDHLATSRPRVRKAHQQAHGGRCLTCTHRGKASSEHHIYSTSKPG